MQSNKYKLAPAMINKRLTKYYDVFVNLVFVGQALQKRTLSLLSLGSGQKFLDIGCGTGTLVCLVKSEYTNVKVYGADPDKSVLDAATKKAKLSGLDIQYVQAGAEKLPFADNTFDVITSSLAFHHMPLFIKREALLEIKRILKPAGTFFLVDIGKPRNVFWKLIYYFESMVEPKEYIKDNLTGLLPNLMTEAGFTIQEVRKPYLGIYFWRAKQSQTKK